MLYQRENPHGGDIYKGTIRADFSSNINPLGTPTWLLEAMTEALSNAPHYPDPYCRRAVHAVSEYEDIPEDYILLGNGAAALIYSFCRAVQPSSALIPVPAFSEYEAALTLNNTGIIHHFLRRETGFSPDERLLDDIEQHAPNIVFLCNPNNPTGRLTDPDLLQKLTELCHSKGTMLFADECFLEFTSQQDILKELLPDYPNLFILKAFTKSYALAGIRIGYLLNSDPHLMQRISAMTQPWDVSLIAQAAACAIKRGNGYMEKTRELIRNEREWMTKELSSFGFEVCPSDANFLLFHAPAGLDRSLLREHVAIRNCANYIGLQEGWYRAAVRSHNENEILIDALKKISGEMH